MVTIRDVAERAGVSIGTASRVLNGHPAVGAAGRAAVRDAIRELNYVPNAAARALRAARTMTLGLIVPDLLNPMTVRLLRGVEDAALDAGYTLLVAESRLDEQLEAIHIGKLIDRQVDGLLCSPVGPIASVGRLVERSGTPTVLLQLRKPARDFPTVYVDEGPAVSAALDHLARLGHHRIAFIHSLSRAAGGRHRRDLIRSERALHGLDDAADLDRTFTDGPECLATVREVLQAPNRPTALMVGIHQFIPAALNALREEHLQVGKDISLVVFGDSEWVQAMSPALSVIAVDQEDHARSAVGLLLDTMSGTSSPPRAIHTESVFTNRESCGPAPAGVKR